MSVAYARSSLHRRGCPLTPFIVHFGDSPPLLIYGDPKIMSIYTPIFDGIPKDQRYSAKAPWEHSSYITLHLPSSDGFLYVWYAINALSPDYSFTDILKRECYHVPMVGLVPPVKLSSEIEPAPISAYRIMKAFRIPISNDLWGKWFLGIFSRPFTERDKPILSEALPQLTRYFPPPNFYWDTTMFDRKDPEDEVHSPPTINRFDKAILSLFPSDPPISIRSNIGRKVEASDIHKMIISEYRGNGVVELDEPYIAIHNDFIWYMDTCEITEHLLHFRLSSPFPHSTERRVAYLYPEDEEPKRPYILMQVDKNDGTVIELAAEEYRLPGGLNPAEIIADISFYTAKFPRERMYDTMDKIPKYPNKASYPGTYDTIYETYDWGKNIAFRFTDGMVIGNLVAMASRSEWMRSLLESAGGVSIHSISLSCRGAPFITFWRWLNTGVIQSQPRYHGIDVYCDYFAVSRTSSLYRDIVLSLTPTQAQERKRVLSVDQLWEIYSNLQPISEIGPTLHLIGFDTERGDETHYSSVLAMPFLTYEESSVAGPESILIIPRGDTSYDLYRFHPHNDAHMPYEETLVSSKEEAIDFARHTLHQDGITRSGVSNYTIIRPRVIMK